MELGNSTLLFEAIQRHPDCILIVKFEESSPINENPTASPKLKHRSATLAKLKLEEDEQQQLHQPHSHNKPATTVAAVKSVAAQSNIQKLQDKVKKFGSWTIKKRNFSSHKKTSSADLFSSNNNNSSGHHQALSISDPTFVQKEISADFDKLSVMSSTLVSKKKKSIVWI